LDNKPKVYLLKIVNDDKTLYKIGFTRNNVYNRIKDLQTGCPYEIQLVDSFSSDYSMIIERTLHNVFYSKKTYGEWFELGIKEEVEFKELCKKYENIQIILNKKENL
jgi:hypothetical protein